jgi:hypothetical protein
MFRALSFLAVLLTAAWLGSAPTLEPAASLAVALATLLYAERRHVRSLRPQASGARDTSAVDRLTLEAFLKDLPEDGPIGYFANRTCANPFDITHLYALEEAAVRCSAANREFLNPALESAKRRLLDNTAEFISTSTSIYMAFRSTGLTIGSAKPSNRSTPPLRLSSRNTRNSSDSRAGFFSRPSAPPNPGMQRTRFARR